LAVRLELFEFFERFGTLAVDAGFLDEEITEFLLIGQMRLQHDHAAAGWFRLFGKGFGELAFAVDVESVFEFLDSTQAPAAIDNNLDEFAFDLAHGFQIELETFEEDSVFLDVIGGKKDGTAGERRLDGVLGRALAAGVSAWAGGELGIGSVGSELGRGDE
jgi:hypothetical protein